MLKFTDVCLITNNVPALAVFYEKLFDAKSEGDETHSFIAVSGLGIAISSKTSSLIDLPELFYTDHSTYKFFIGFCCEDETA